MEGSSFGWLSLLPPLIAITLCIVTRNVIPSLVLGIFTGIFIINGFNPITALLDTASKYIVGKGVADSWNAGLLVFCLIIGGMVGVMNKSGGIQAVAYQIAKKAKGKISTQIATTFLGILIFIDDYASCLITGNTMRPISDAQKISREKLSFIVDATAASISSVIPISTWIAMELGLIQEGLAGVGIKANAIAVFLQSVPYRFYVLFLVIFMFASFIMRKDYGSMLKAEIRARKTGEVYDKNSHPMYQDSKEILPDEGVKGTIWDFILPILTFIIVTVIGLRYNGWAGLVSDEMKIISSNFFKVIAEVNGEKIVYTFRDILGNADSSVVLTWASFIASIEIILQVIVERRMSFTKAIDAWINGVKSMILAVIILALALTLKAVIDEMGTANYVVEITKPILNGAWIPFVVFLIACILSFATGTSWGTMAILMPIAIPLAAAASNANGYLTSSVVATIGSVLGGAIYGDHCSPISDTTILASTSAGSDHIAHVTTQLPYASTVALAGGIFGYLPFAIGVPVWVSLILGTIGIILFLYFFGKKIDDNGNIIK
jgi:Na+/H+ antiporter NhaC